VLVDAGAAFRGWGGTSLAVPEVKAPLPPAARQPVAFLRREPASTLITCATRPVSELKASDEALEVLTALLGQGMGSRLQLALRERGGLTYATSASLVRRRKARALVACAALQAGRAAEGLRLFREALEELRASRPSEAEVAQARALRLAQIESAWDDAHRIRHAWMEALVLGEARPALEGRRARLERVTADEVWRLAREGLRPASLRWVVSGDRKAAARAAEENGLGRPVALSLGR
jgi:zinc protease